MGSSAIFLSRLFFLSPRHQAQDSFCAEIGRTARQSWGDGISPLLFLLVGHTNNIFPPSYTLCYLPVHPSGGTLGFVIQDSWHQGQFSFVLMWERKQKGWKLYLWLRIFNPNYMAYHDKPTLNPDNIKVSFAFLI